jgi:hypothetical protein
MPTPADEAPVNLRHDIIASHNRVMVGAADGTVSAVASRGARMATRRLNEPIEPMTLGNMRANGVRALAVTCPKCHHEAILSVSLTPPSARAPIVSDTIRGFPA